jgi:hypothetical protein
MWKKGCVMRHQPRENFGVAAISPHKIENVVNNRHDGQAHKLRSTVAPANALVERGSAKLLNHAFPLSYDRGYAIIGFEHDPCYGIFPLGIQNKDGFSAFSEGRDLRATGDPSRPLQLMMSGNINHFRAALDIAQEWVRTVLDGQPANVSGR